MYKTGHVINIILGSVSHHCHL